MVLPEIAAVALGVSESVLVQRDRGVVNGTNSVEGAAGGHQRYGGGASGAVPARVWTRGALHGYVVACAISPAREGSWGGANL